MAKVKLLDPTDESRRLDRYELIGEIATGGMATVFLARLGGVGGFQRFVAIKRLHPHLANEDEFVEMFLDEARLAAGIHHPHVVPILEVGTSESGYYLVMEYVEGDTLARIVARAMSGGMYVPRQVLVRCILDALSGLHAAHELTDERGQLLGLVHRDISPQNILVGVDGSSRITDFGVARATSRLSNTGTGRLKGKLAYMAPEQMRGEDLDRRTDLFAMGTILWEVLAGQRLFKAATEAATLSKILIQPIPRVTERNPEVPEEFEEVTQRALDRDQTRRYQSAAEMADALERAANAAAKRSPTDVGVASPREVAAFVQKVLGQEIGAQRESVRAWLAQSESSAPRVNAPARPPKDVTVKLPLDRPGRQRALAAAGHDADPAPSSEGEDQLTNPRLPRDPAMIEDESSTDEPLDSAAEVSKPAGERSHQVARAELRAAQRAAATPLPVPVMVMPSEPPGGGLAAPYEPAPFSDPEPPMHRTRGRTVGLVLGFLIAFVVGLLWVRFRTPSGDPAPSPGDDHRPRDGVVQGRASAPRSASGDASVAKGVGATGGAGGEEGTGEGGAGKGGAAAVEGTGGARDPSPPPSGGATRPPRPRVPPPRASSTPDEPPPPTPDRPATDTATGTGTTPPPPPSGPGEDFSNPYR